MLWNRLIDCLETVVVSLAFCIYVIGVIASVFFIVLFTVLIMALPYIIIFGVFALFLYVTGYLIF